MNGNLNLWQILWASGPVVKVVLLILVAMSAVSWGIILQKMKELKAIEEANKVFIEIFKSHGNMSEIFQHAINHQDSTMGLVYRKGHEEMSKWSDKFSQQQEMAKHLKEANFIPIERSLKHGINLASEKMDFRLATLASISSITPFIGLFGTVWGIIDAFSGLSSGGGSIEAVAPGIAEALVATAVGLAAAIPSGWFYNVFTSKIGQLNSQLESFSQDFLNLVERTLVGFSKE